MYSTFTNRCIEIELALYFSRIYNYTKGFSVTNDFQTIINNLSPSPLLMGLLKKFKKPT